MISDGRSQFRDNGVYFGLSPSAGNANKTKPAGHHTRRGALGGSRSGLVETCKAYAKNFAGNFSIQ